MSKDLGTKHVCFKCATKFYDLKKPVPACPRCGVDQRTKPAAPVRTAPKRTSATSGSREEAVDEPETEVGAEAEADDTAEDDAD